MVCSFGKVRGAGEGRGGGERMSSANSTPDMNEKHVNDHIW